MARWTLTLGREGGKSWRVSVRGLWLAVPAVLALFAFALQAGPWNQWPAEPDRDSAEIVPLNVRDPSNLVMSPWWGTCRSECPSVSKPQ
ncbi:MAG: hypothetical protein HY928_06910 [Elusimicrobia bacterium]|nr:hypothetical protein [Elusimicrobiota bacterium]